MVRLSHGHIRIGSFQRLATLGLHDELKRLSDYCLHHYYGEDGPPERLLALVAERTAQLAASYMAAGFVHGVLNSDNINITGESFDYGPWRFAPTFDADFTAAYFDSAGLYSFGRQAEAIHWDVVQLAIALHAIADQAALEAALAAFAPAYRAALIDRFLLRLGVIPKGDDRDLELVQAIETQLVESQESIDRFFFDHAGNRSGSFGDYAPAIDLSHPYWARSEPCSMLIEEVESIWQSIADHDDWTMLNAKVTTIRQMGDALANRKSSA
jgi:serine/tyrosine/threonine adenylyltransferase